MRSMKWLACVLVLACHDATVTTPQTPTDWVMVDHAAAPFENDHSPRVDLVGESVTVDGEPAGDVREALREGRPQRIDALFVKMHEKRDAWLAVHPGSSLPGLVQFHFPPSATKIVVMSVVQTTAFAAYPYGEYEVRRSDGSPGHLGLDALVPMPNESPPEPEVRVRVFSGHIALAFADGTEKTTTLEALGAALGTPHSVLLSFEPTATFETMMHVADAVVADKRVVILGMANP